MAYSITCRIFFGHMKQNNVSKTYKIRYCNKSVTLQFIAKPFRLAVSTSVEMFYKDAQNVFFIF